MIVTIKDCGYKLQGQLCGQNHNGVVSVQGFNRTMRCLTVKMASNDSCIVEPAILRLKPVK